MDYRFIITSYETAIAIGIIMAVVFIVIFAFVDK